MKASRVVAIAWKEWREVVRDRLYFTMAFLLPLITLLVLGYGLSFDVENIPFAVLDQDRSELSREYLHRFMDSRYFEYRGDARSEAELERLLADSRIRLGLVVPPRFGERLRAARPVAVQGLVDGVFPYRAEVTKGYLAAMNAGFNAGLLEDHLVRRGLAPERAQELLEPVRVQTRYLYNQALSSRWSLASGLIMLVLMFVPPFLTTLGIVREKEFGSIYNIYASNVSRGEFLLGKLAPYALICWINVGILWAVAMLVFGAPFKGDPWFYYGASMVYVICTAGIGLLVSLLVRTQAAAILLSVTLSFIPATLYSGLLVPVQSMDPAARFEARLFPAVYYLDIVWGTFLKGLGAPALWPNLVALAVYAAVLWGVGYALFHKRPRR